MKRLAFLFSLACMLSFTACAKENNPENTDLEQEENKEFVATGWNGYYVEEMAKAYETFVETDQLPATITIEGIKYGRGKMFAAGYKLLLKIMAEPDTWQDEEVDFNDRFSCSDNVANNTITVDEISFEDYMGYMKRAYEYAEKGMALPNYVTMQSGYVDADGSKYDVRIVSLALSVGLARVFHYFKEHNELPETVSTWHTDYLRSTANCPIDDPVVVAKMKEITEGKKTDYEKAEAIFYYSLDEWEWIDYSNTSRGAVKTIQQNGGNCCDLSHAVVAMARAAGLPARYYHAQCKYKKSGSTIGHVMAQIYVDGKWYLCDPSSSGTTFGNHEAWSTMETFNGLYKALPF